eukprot:360861-Chlamydomonas_euryale.AAC.3
MPRAGVCTCGAWQPCSPSSTSLPPQSPLPPLSAPPAVGSMRSPPGTSAGRRPGCLPSRWCHDCSKFNRAEERLSSCVSQATPSTWSRTSAACCWRRACVARVRCVARRRACEAAALFKDAVMKAEAAPGK